MLTKIPEKVGLLLYAYYYPVGFRNSMYTFLLGLYIYIDLSGPICGPVMRLGALDPVLLPYIQPIARELPRLGRYRCLLIGIGGAGLYGLKKWVPAPVGPFHFGPLLHLYLGHNIIHSSSRRHGSKTCFYVHIC